MYTLNKNVKLKLGGRNIAKITDNEFLQKVDEFIKKKTGKNKSSECYFELKTYKGLDKTPDKDDLFDYFNTALLDYLYNEESELTKDLKGITPDFENFIIIKTDDGEILRHTKKDNIPFISYIIGGDWEIGMIIFVYYDGKSFRIYVPEKGNTWRKDTKTLIGNIFDEDDCQHIIISDEKYILNELYKQGDITKEFFDNFDYDNCPYPDVTHDMNMCIEDFESRTNQN